MNALVIAAHPDDEVLGCGGTIARLSQAGHSVYIAIMGEGITSRYAQRNLAPHSLIKKLHNRSRQAAKLLGAKDMFAFKLPDNRFDTVPLLDVVKKIEALIKRFKPSVIYTQHGGDLNIDHAIVYRATLTATRPVAGCPVKELLTYEIPSSTDWAFGQFAPAFRPNVFVDISATLERKIKVMQLYESELCQFPHPRSPEALRSLAKWRGSMAGVEAAEAFELIRAIR